MKKLNGFTLVELMITIAVLAVLMGIAIPNFSTMVKNNRLTTTTNNIIAAIQTARAEAVNRNVPVLFCQNNGANTGCDASFGFANGWLIGLDANSDGTVDANGVIRVQAAPPATIAVTTTNIASNFLRYQNNGMVESYGTVPGRIQICDDRSGESSREIVIGATGSINLDPSAYTCP